MRTNQTRYQGVFGKMDFPSYVFREYPKIVRRKDGSKVRVNSKEEETREVMTDTTKEPSPDPDRQRMEQMLVKQQEQIATLQAQLRQQHEEETKAEREEAEKLAEAVKEQTAETEPPAKGGNVLDEIAASAAKPDGKKK